jgi:CelD/BcsL family acetyltransferase involved in cellulose biosynthesis
MDLTLHTSFPADLQTEWNDLLAESITHVPFLRHEYLRSWWQHLGGGEWDRGDLSIITAREHGRLVGIAPLFHTIHQSRPSLFLLGSIEISDYLDLIARPADLQPFIAELLPFLASTALPQWETLDLYNLLDSSPAIPALQVTVNTLGWKMEVQQLQHSPYIPLPGNFETYLAGIDKKQRHEIRRKMRRIEEFGIPIRWYFTEDPAQLDSDMDAFLNLMALDTDKAKFLTPAMRDQMKDIAQCAFSGGCLKLAFLEIGGKKAAAYLNFDYLDRLWVYNSGIDWSYNEYSPGWVLLGHLLQWANENQRTEFDFMRGSEDYKYRFGAIDRFVERVTISR